jgi:glycine/D-amino acid oxidase-like deaminating enzyme
MYRKMYSDEFFSKMQATALKRWKDIEKKCGESLLEKNGLLFYGEDTGETVEGSVLGAKKTMENLNLDHTFYGSGDDIAKAYPALKGCQGMPYSGVYEADAGHIKASKACEAMAKVASEVCDVHVNTKIVSLDTTNNNGVVATTEDGLTFKADNVVIAAGPWTNSVLESANLPTINVKVWEIQWAHYRVKESVASSIPQAFHFRKGQCKEDGGLYYVFPASATESVPNNGNNNDDDGDEYTYVKVGVDFPSGGDTKGMDAFDYNGSEKVLDLMDGWVKEHLPDVEERIEQFTSPYTMTDDSYFVMDKVAKNVAIFSGGSGRAFKFAPLIGDCMASLVRDEEPPIEIERFSASREALICLDPAVVH